RLVVGGHAQVPVLPDCRSDRRAGTADPAAHSPQRRTSAMSLFKRKGWLLAGLALIALTNCWILASVAYNRSGEPEAVLLLSERELLPSRHWRQQENSGVALALLTRQPRADKARAPIDLSVMRQLGFSIEM